ncbi:MAG: hypothetical protein DLM67_02975 [Candidatus Nephthysia bennettiae]|uniref:glycosyltransferase n=1 Tax=Candidatus Nephthysia bennettiae TaxID=3127016 RepID=UPI000DB83193|nr:MAG: hypothetical protein DLM67_02975 [Candidatus Dormibacteraeota bacterium]
MGGSHFSVLASLEESFPNVLLESMASAVRVAATKGWVVSEFIQDGVDSFLIPPGKSVPSLRQC